MENSTPLPPPPAPTKLDRFTSFIQRITDNPLAFKELRGRMRGGQAPVLLTLYLGLIAVFVFFVYSNMSIFSSGVNWDPSMRQAAGKAVFATVVLLELLLVSFIAPGLTAGAITSERERQTYELLRTTLLSARSLVLGKLGSAFFFLLLLILTAVPVQSLAFLLGGVDWVELTISTLMLIVTAAFFCALGIYFSSQMQRTIVATVGAYAFTLLTFLGIIFILFIIGIYEGFGNAFNNTPLSDISQVILLGIIWILVSLNPFMSAIISETILVSEQNAFYTTDLFFSSNLPVPFLPSPWILYVIFYSLLTILLIHLSIRSVNRPER